MGGGMGSAHSPVKSHSTKTFKISFTSEGGKTSDIMALPTLTGDHDDEPTPNSKPEVAVHAHPSVAEHVNDLKGLMASGADALADPNVPRSLMRSHVHSLQQAPHWT